MSTKYIVAILSAVLFLSYFIIGSTFLLLIGLVLGALAAYLYFIDEKKLFLNIADPQISTKISCDHYKLGQVLRNLLSNAIKYTQQ